MMKTSLLPLRRCLVVLVSLLVVLAATALSPARASAAPGAQGRVDRWTKIGTSTYRTAGWAYNGRTVPVQSVRFLGYRVAGGDDRYLGAGQTGLSAGTSPSPTYAMYANKYRPDVVRAGVSNTPYVGFAGDVTFYSGTPSYVIVQIHDTGESAGWVTIGTVGG